MHKNLFYPPHAHLLNSQSKCQCEASRTIEFTTGGKRGCCVNRALFDQPLPSCKIHVKDTVSTISSPRASCVFGIHIISTILSNNHPPRPPAQTSPAHPIPPDTVTTCTYQFLYSQGRTRLCYALSRSRTLPNPFIPNDHIMSAQSQMPDSPRGEHDYTSTVFDTPTDLPHHPYGPIAQHMPKPIRVSKPRGRVLQSTSPDSPRTPSSPRII